MTPGTRLLEAARALLSDRSLCGQDTPERTVRDALSDARALYPAAHAIGDRVSVVYSGERKPGYEDLTGVVTGVEFTDTGVDYRVKGDGDPGYSVVEARFVRAAPAVDAHPDMPTPGPGEMVTTTPDEHGRFLLYHTDDGRNVASYVYPDGHREPGPEQPRSGRVEVRAVGVDARLVSDLSTVADDRERIVWQQAVKPIVIPGHEMKPGHLTSDEANALVRRAMLDSYCPRDSSVSVADEARAFDPFDESFSDEARIGGERALNLFADMLEARDTHITSPNYEGAARFLWQLLDDISTLDDACRDNDAAFRTHACAIVEKRGRVAASFDGQTLHFVGSEGWTRGMVQPTGNATYVVPGVRVVESPHVTGAFLINTASPAAQEAMVAGLRDITARETSVVASGAWPKDPK